MPRPKRVIGYARVSSQEQALGTSLKDQQNAISAYAKGRGLAVAKFYVEAGSAIHEKFEKRLQMQALMADVRAGDLVLCDKLDRWSRDPEFTYRSVRQILEANALFYAVGDTCDPSTAEGDTLLNFRVLFAREEHKRIKQRMVGTRKLLRDQGYYSEGLAPFGYRRPVPKGHHHSATNVLVVQEDEAALIRRMYRLCIAGRSINNIAERLALHRDRVAEYLHNRIYLGEIRNSHGQWIRGKHPAIIDADLYGRAQDALRSRHRIGSRATDGGLAETESWVLRDVARCGRCGAKMGAAYAGEKGISRRYYFRCVKRCQSKGNRATNGGFFPVPLAEEVTEPLIVERLGELKDEIGSAGKNEPARGELPLLTERLADLQRRRERALDVYVEGHMSKEKLAATMAKLDAAQLRLDGESHAAKQQSALSDPKVRREVLREVSELRRAWKNASPSVRRQIVNVLAKSVLLKRGAEPRVDWRSAEEIAGMRP